MWYIITSEDNHSQTVSFFEQKKFFGLKESQIKFIQQGMVPSLDLNGKLILKDKAEIFLNPNGHGGTLYALKKSGTLDEMVSKGIEEIFYFQVDNPLVKIADPLFIGAHIDRGAQMSTKVVKKTDPKEKVGIIGKINGKMGCIEYSELTEEQMYERLPDGGLRFSSANIAIHMINRDFIEEITTKPECHLPWHIAVKDIQALVEEDGKCVLKPIKGIKFEMFIFDALRFTKESVVLEVNREEEFSPVKNSSGIDSPDTARIAMRNLYIKWLEKAGYRVGSKENFWVEISPLYALDEEEFLKRFSPSNLNISPLYLGP